MGRQHTLSLDGLEPVRAPWCEFPEEDRRRAVEIPGAIAGSGLRWRNGKGKQR